MSARLTSLILVLALSGTARADGEGEVDHSYAIGARLRGIFVTPAMLGSFLTTTSGMNSMSGGAEFIYRKPTYDVVTSLDLSFINLQDGNFLASGHPANLDTHYLQFGNFGQLTFLSFDVSIIGHTSLARWFEIRYGAGVGLGLLLGDIRIINNGRQCTDQNLSDINKCYPQAANVDIPLGRADSEAKLKATETGEADTAISPHRHATPDKPPVLPVVNVLVGFRFKVQRHLAFDLEVGFRNAIFAGGAFHILF